MSRMRKEVVTCMSDYLGHASGHHLCTRVVCECTQQICSTMQMCCLVCVSSPTQLKPRQAALLHVSAAIMCVREEVKEQYVATFTFTHAYTNLHS